MFMQQKSEAWHGGKVVSTVASQQKGLGFEGVVDQSLSL